MWSRFRSSEAVKLVLDVYMFTGMHIVAVNTAPVT